MSVKKKDAVATAKELNKVLGLDPPIDVKEDLKTLKELILYAADLIEPEDKISKKTLKVIEDLREESTPTKLEEEEEVEEEEEEVEEEEVEEEEVEEEEVEEVQKGKKKNAAKNPAKNTKSTPPTTGAKITRIAAAALVVKKRKDMSIQEWIKRTDEIYVKEGGKSNIKESKYAVNVTIKVLEAYGIIHAGENAIKVL